MDRWAPSAEEDRGRREAFSVSDGLVHGQHGHTHTL